MAPPETFQYTTGDSLLPDVGRLKYNGCLFSPLFYTEVSGKAVMDAANRTVMYMEYTITADGYVTAPTPKDLEDDFWPGPGDPPHNNGIDDTETAGRDEVVSITNIMRNLLTKQGGELIYQGRGLDITVNPDGGADIRDVAWGPAPVLLEFQPLGGGLSAKVKWQITIRIPEDTRQAKKKPARELLTRAPNRGQLGAGATPDIPLLQFNYETRLNYNDGMFSSLTVNGTLEIPLTRTPNQKVRTLTQTADDLRAEIENRVMVGIDLSRFRVAERDFTLSRDKRVLTWSFKIVEKPYMDLPPGCTVARGSYSVRPSKQGFGLVKWFCTLRATYTVRGPFRQSDVNVTPRRVAWTAFLALLRFRMAFSELAPDDDNSIDARVRALVLKQLGLDGAIGTLSTEQINTRMLIARGRKAFLCDFTVEEGLYEDSGTTSFSASWVLTTPFNHILLASGLWRRLPETNAQGANLWATSVNDISGERSWLANRADPKLDVIVDFGGG